MCQQSMCGCWMWIKNKAYISFTNDYPNCWCTDCHRASCWNRLAFRTNPEGFSESDDD